MRIFVVLLATLLLTACGGGEPDAKPKPTESLAEAKDETALEHAEKHLDTKYVCPMHPEVVRDEPGNCPICGMNLEKKAATALEHANKHLDAKYVCPMHPEVVSDKPGNCPICGMNLLEKGAE